LDEALMAVEALAQIAGDDTVAPAIRIRPSVATLL